MKKILRVLQVGLILLGLIGLSLFLVSLKAPEARTAATFLLLEGVLPGLLLAILSLFVFFTGIREGVLTKISALMFATLGVYTVTWTLLSKLLGIHSHASIDLAGRALRIGFGFIAGWFAVILLIYSLQLIRGTIRDEESEEE